ncbi:regulatory protein RecX [Paucibacter soli]|uniref:regulatory protein RecX n=1 Tax=Paucibacter soli TaxID=3133433 RepID=UPI0030AA7B55
MVRGQPLSLKARAIGLLAQREHSLAELRRKLMRLTRQSKDAAAQDGEVAGQDPAAEVDALLVWLQAQGYLSETRFVESRIHARSQRYGNLRIQQELAQHGLRLEAEQLTRLKDGEFERARQIWQRKFGGEAPVDAAARAKQMRFLAGRGFSPEVIRRVLRADDE